MNLLSAIAPTSIPVDPIEGIQGRVAFAAAVKAVKVTHEMARETLRLLAPETGTNLDRRA